MTTVVASAGGVTASKVSYTYDTDGNTLTTTDGDGNVTTDTYDSNQSLRRLLPPPTARW